MKDKYKNVNIKYEKMKIMKKINNNLKKFNKKMSN